MTELSEKDQKWLDDLSQEIELGDHYYNMIDTHTVRDYLIQKDAEHKAEIEKLKAHVEYLVDVVDEVSTATNANMLPQEVLDLAANAIASVPQQSLAQHDKQVKIEVLFSLINSMPKTGHGGEIMTVRHWALKLIEKYESELKEQE